MNRAGAAVAATLSLLCTLAALPAAAAPAAPAAEPLPRAPGRVVPVRPGGLLKASVAVGTVGYASTLVSRAFHAPVTLRMNDPLLTGTAAVACDAEPALYPVTVKATPDDPGSTWTTLRVLPVTEAQRRECRLAEKNLPSSLDPLEERWPADAPWPQTPWDVRDLAPCSRIVATEGDEVPHRSGAVSLTSPAFEGRAVLRGDKATTATATVRCDARPGIYAVYQHDSDHPGALDHTVWARFRVVAGAPSATAQQPGAGRPRESRGPAALWAAGAAAVAVLGTGSLLLVRRARSRRSAPGTPGAR